MVFQAREGNFLKKKYYGRARRNYLTYPFLKWEQTAVSILAVVFRFWTIPNRGDLAMASTSQEKHVEKATSNYQNRSRLNGCRFWIYLGVGHALKKLRVLCGGVLKRECLMSSTEMCGQKTSMPSKHHYPGFALATVSHVTSVSYTPISILLQ